MEEGKGRRGTRGKEGRETEEGSRNSALVVGGIEPPPSFRREPVVQCSAFSDCVDFPVIEPNQRRRRRRLRAEIDTMERCYVLAVAIVYMRFSFVSFRGR